MASKITAGFFSRAPFPVGGRGSCGQVWCELNRARTCWCPSCMSPPPPPAHPTPHGVWLSLVRSCLSHSIDWGPPGMSEILAGSPWGQNHVCDNTSLSLSFHPPFLRRVEIPECRSRCEKSAVLTVSSITDFCKKQKILLFISVIKKKIDVFHKKYVFMLIWNGFIIALKWIDKWSWNLSAPEW